MHSRKHAPPTPPPELLAPAGQPDAGYAALHYGADAVYLGLDRFSARAEAVNFTPEDLAEFAAYAHSLTPRRNVYLTLNTVVKQAELAAAAETLLAAAACGVDAVIVQDLGVARLIRERFPDLRLHSSTQLAVHNLSGALAARELGFRRVTLARELTLDEVRRIAGEAGIEVETFIHGTLCYAYSGMCLYSSMVAGRSGNRGRCVYTCREAADTPAGRAHPFSLKDLALGERVRDYAAAGVASLKIEGRKKSPLYVAATVDYYRRLLDGAIGREEAEETEARLKTIFARPWTRFFLDGPRNPDAADPDVVGHRGARIGRVEKLVRTPAGAGIAFTPDRPVERHDGLQIDLPGEPRPFGFPVDDLFAADGKRLTPVFTAEAGRRLAVALPADAPELAPGLPLYHSSSQAVKRSYPYERPRPGAHGVRLPMNVAISVRREAGEGGAERCRIVCDAEAPSPPFLRGFATPTVRAGSRGRVEETVPAFPARDADGAEKTARDSFSRTGDHIFRLDGWRFDNPDALFVKPGEWNRLRRAAIDALAAAHAGLLAEARRELAELTAGPPAAPAARSENFSWTLCVDAPSHLAAFTGEALRAAREIVVGIGEGEDFASWRRDLERLAEAAGSDRIRLALPLVLRGGEAEIARRAGQLHDDGWRRWLVPGLGAWRLVAGRDGADMTADWPLYTLNRFTVLRLGEMGFSGVTLSPEDDADNLREMLRAFGDRAGVVVYSDVPLFISAACAHAHLGLCPRPGKDVPPACANSQKILPIRMEQSGPAGILSTNCGSLVFGDAYSLAGRLDELRAMGAEHLRLDLRWGPRTPDETFALWRDALAGRLPGGNLGNFDRGLL